jgi:hypothetical protein
VLLSACFHPDYDHPQCGPRGECPRGFICIDQVCEPEGAVPLALELPDGPLAPSGFASADVILHGPSGDAMRTAQLAGVALDLGTVDPGVTTSVEITLRAGGGAVVGYGRTTVVRGTRPVIAARRPIVYAAGTISNPPPANPTGPLTWTGSPATFFDLAAAAAFDGTTQIGTEAVLTIAAGPALYLVTQAVSDPNGVLTGPASILPVSTADHRLGAALAGVVTGSAIDGAGSDDGSVLAIGTTTQLFAIDTATGAARAVADGSFARVAILATAAGELDAVAIKNRGSTTAASCATTAELWWAPLAGAPVGAAAHMVAAGGFSDIATDRGHAYYVDACTGQLGEATASGIQALTTVPAPSSGATSRPTALAVANGQAYVALESQPETLSLVMASLATGDPPRMLWTDHVQQALGVTTMPEVQRVLDATQVVLDRLELGAGGDYVALTTQAHFHGAEIAAEAFPDMTVDTEELRVLDAHTGAAIERYRSWCDGVIVPGTDDITSWQCATVAGQTAPASPALEHHIASMAFLFGKR